MSRIVVCCPSSVRHARRTAEQRALLAVASWCAARRLYPGPGTVVVLDSYRNVRDAARTLGVSEAVLVDALHGLTRSMPRAVNVFAHPIAAVAFQVRPLNGSGDRPRRMLWSAAA